MMASNLYERSLTATLGFQPLADSPLVMDATIIMSPKNASNVAVRFLGMSGSPGETMVAQWPPGATVHLRSVDLYRITVSVPSQNHMLVVGQAP